MHAWLRLRLLQRGCQARPQLRLALKSRSISTDIPASSTVFSGIQPTGVPHLGNYLGALKPWVDLQHIVAPETKLIFSIVDLHAVTVRQDPDLLRQWKKETLAALLAVGLNPERCSIYFQSDVTAHTELMWILSCSASVGQLSRMTQWKSKLSLSDSSSLAEGAAKGNLRLGLFSYPVLQAADILIHRATHVPVGQDQKQHLEFARGAASAFNHTYGKTLAVPDVLLSPARKVMSLKHPTQKMSKSHADPESRILLTDGREAIHSKITGALTDSEAGVSWDPKLRPGVSNLLEIASALSPEALSPVEFAQRFEGQSMKHFKRSVADVIDDAVVPIRAAFEKLMQPAHEGYLQEIAAAGAKQADGYSRPVLAEVYHKVGLR